MARNSRSEAIRRGKCRGVTGRASKGDVPEHEKATRIAEQPAPRTLNAFGRWGW